MWRERPQRRLPRRRFCAGPVSLAVVAQLVASGGASNAPDDMQPELDLRSAPACYTLLNNEGTIGCRSPRPGSTPVAITVIDAQSQLDAFVTRERRAASAVLLEASLFTSDSLAALQRSGWCAGVILADGTTPPPHGFSPAGPMPYCKCGAAPPCSGRWNPSGNSLEQHSFDFPMIAVTEVQAAALRRRIARGSSDPQQFPRFQVQMNLYMDVFDGYDLEAGQWWELQHGTRCCPSCRPTCGTACCAAGFACVSASTKDVNVSWTAPKCARRQVPTSLSCISRGTCLPIGGYNVWSLNSLALPGDAPPTTSASAASGAPSPTRIVMVAANLDSSSLFHDMAPGASADGSAVVALIAAADALRAVRTDMSSRGGASLMYVLLQAENWDHVGSRRLFHDMEAFKCRKRRRGGGDGASSDVCLDPPMLAPDIERVNTSMIDFVLHVEQLLPSDEPTLFLHSGCHPSPHTQAMQALLLNQGGAAAGSGVLGLTAASPGLPLPSSSFLSSIFEGVQQGGAASAAASPPQSSSGMDPGKQPSWVPKGMGVLAGYNSAFKTPLYHSRFDRGGAGIDLQHLCAAASRLSMALYTLSTGLTAPPIFADCSLVSKLSQRLMGVPSPQASNRGEGRGMEKPGNEPFQTAYSSVYLPPILRGPSERETYVHQQLALANAVPAGDGTQAPCNCCTEGGASRCTPQPFTHCVVGKCLKSLTFLHDAYPVGVEYSLSKSAFILSNGTDARSLRCVVGHPCACTRAVSLGCAREHPCPC